jgi:hypothetical protein
VGRTTDTKIRRSLEVAVPALVQAAVNSFYVICQDGTGANVILNSVCTGGGYLGATGVYGYTAGSLCAAKSGGASRVTFTDQGVLLTAGTGYYVQCY